MELPMPVQPLLVEPVPALERLPPYSVGRPPFETDLTLDFNESLEALPVSGSAPEASNAHLYPWTAQLEVQLAQRMGVDPERVIVTCGADDALERSVRSVCCPGRRAVMIKPTYGMPWRYAITSGAEIIAVPWWRGSFPVDEVCDAAGNDAALIFLVSPNNPTGSVITREEFTAVAERLPRTLILHDQAYREFADPEFDLTETALAYPNVVLVRTFSKAWGGAGLRVGYAVGDARIVDWLRRIGQPFPVSRLSLELLEVTLASAAEPSIERIDRIRLERDRLTQLLADLGAEPVPSQASFVLARFNDASWLRTAMAALGIAIRGFPGRSALDNWLRTTLPGNTAAFVRLTGGFRTVLRPDALVFHLGGEPPWIEPLPLRADRIRELDADALPGSTTRNDEPTPPDPVRVQRTLELLEGRPAWLVSDTPEAIRAARSAAVLPIGFAASGDNPSALRSILTNAGAARVFNSLDEIAKLLP